MFRTGEAPQQRARCPCQGRESVGAVPGLSRKGDGF
jgi:hypothetical protein